jgi:hypothetical protein
MQYRRIITIVVVLLVATLMYLLQKNEPMKIERQTTGGILFFRTQQQENLHEFYLDRVGCTLWLDQGGCRIYQHGNMLFGFCQRDTIDTQGMITFYYGSAKEVDEMYKKFQDVAEAPPKQNDDYGIYHFFARDPEGRAVEFQYFLE